jgi:dolichol-phosphate mannosyltransferase
LERRFRGEKTAAQILRFCAIGIAGLIVNLCVFAVCISTTSMTPAAAAVCAFSIAVLHNYLLNRRWTFRGASGAAVGQAARFYLVSAAGLGLNLAILTALTRSSLAEVPAQAIAVVLVTPTTFTFNKLWTFRSRSPASPSGLERTRHRPRPRTLCVCVPTYNESENIGEFVRQLLGQFDEIGIAGVVLIIDDASPDGTGEIADRLAEEDQRVCVLHGGSKRGIGGAYKVGFRWAIERGFDVIGQMDCDFSHDPRSLPDLLDASQHADVVLGSRYVRGGRVENWPLSRRIVSRGGSFYARTLLGVSVRDFTGGFKCFWRDVLEEIPFESAEAKGYGFQIELTFRAIRGGFRVVEVPIVFRDRIAGESKMNSSIAREAALLVLRLRSTPAPQLRHAVSPAEATVPAATASDP